MADRPTITIDLKKELGRVLKEVEAEATADLNTILEEAGNTLVAELQKKSPVDTGVYASGWVMTKQISAWGTTRTVKNETKPSLTHILEYGTRFSSPIQHIRPAIENMVALTEQKLKGGR